ncbi:plastocyanin/azurin family copper-binding protein [Halobacterium wangiae]|uniref:plastocyanin/azurin family copper-binding protein n=1 Tax=Halobacterium wangiae TaxID=2902623 RepID=UPI0032C4B1FF
MDSQVTRRGFLAGLAGGAGVVGAGSVTAQEQTETVDMTDSLVFESDSITVAPGTTVVWENVGSIGHSVTAYEDEIPEEADYFASGGFEAEQTARQSYPSEGDVPGGESYEHTVEVEGTYEYFCIPHESVDMVATMEVTSDPDQGGPTSILPNSARDLAVAGLAALVAVVGLGWAILKYGGDYGEE